MAPLPDIALMGDFDVESAPKRPGAGIVQYGCSGDPNQGGSASARTMGPSSKITWADHGGVVRRYELTDSE